MQQLFGLKKGNHDGIIDLYISLTSIFTSLNHGKSRIGCQFSGIFDPINLGRRISARATVQNGCGAFFHHFQFGVFGHSWKTGRQVSFCKMILKTCVKKAGNSKLFIFQGSAEMDLCHLF